MPLRAVRCQHVTFRFDAYFPRQQKISGALDPGHDLVGQRGTVVLQHHHVTIARYSAIAEVDEVGLGAVLVEPSHNAFVKLARMIGVCGPGHH